MICKMCGDSIYRAKILSFKDGVNEKRSLKLENKDSGTFPVCNNCYYSENGKESYVFRSYFDPSMGVVIDSPFKKREIEKEHGVTYMSKDEKASLTKEAQRNIRQKRIDKHKHVYERIQRDVANGRSFIRELNEMRGK